MPEPVVNKLQLLTVLHMQVTYLTIADFSMREELVLKIAILAEKFAPSVEVSWRPGTCSRVTRTGVRQSCAASHH